MFKLSLFYFIKRAVLGTPICMKALTKQLKLIDFSLLSVLFVSQQVCAQTYLTRNKSLSTFPSLFHEIKKPQSSILNVQSGSKSKFSFSSTHLSPMAPNVEKSLVGYLSNYSRLCICVSFHPFIFLSVCHTSAFY